MSSCQRRFDGYLRHDLSLAMKKPPVSPPGRKSPGRPTFDDSLALRENLLAVALTEFLQHGFKGASIDAIARNSGIGRVTIYRQFGNKEGLFRASLEKRGSWIEANLRSVIAQDKPAEQILLEIIERIHVDFTHPGILAVVRLTIAEALRFPDLCAATWENETREVLAPLVDYLKRLQAQGMLDIGDPEDAAYHLVNMAIGGFRFLINPPLASRQARRRWAQGVLRMVLPALRTPAAVKP